MHEYIVELSKYFIVVFMVLYTFSCFYIFRYREENRRKGIYLVQNILMFAIQIFAFFDICVATKKIQYLFLYAFIQIFLFATVMMVTMIYEKCNRLLLNNMCMLLGIGLCMISRLSLNKAVKQYIIVVASLIISLMIPYLLGVIRFWKKITWLYAAVGISLLSVVLIMGEVTHGSKISFSLGGVTFQPSEFVKILFLFSSQVHCGRMSP